MAPDIRAYLAESRGRGFRATHLNFVIPINLPAIHLRGLTPDSNVGIGLHERTEDGEVDRERVKRIRYSSMVKGYYDGPR